MSKVLITGWNSFTGFYVRKALTEKNYKVVGYCRTNSNENEQDVFKGDLLSFEQVERAVKASQPDYIIHLAGISSVEHKSKLELYNTNLIGTLNLLEATRLHCKKLKHIIIASSANIYGNENEGIIYENAEVNPVNEYAASKAALELAIMPYHKLLPITVVRPFNYTGVGQSDKFLIPKIVNHFAKRISTLELGNIDIARDFSDVRDIASYYTRLVGNEAAVGEVYNLCSGVSTSLAEVLQHLESISGFKPKIIKNELFVRQNDVKSLWGDNTKLMSCIGESRKYDFLNTLHWMYRNNIE